MLTSLHRNQRIIQSKNRFSDHIGFFQHAGTSWGTCPPAKFIFLQIKRVDMAARRTILPPTENHYVIWCELVHVVACFSIWIHLQWNYFPYCFFVFNILQVEALYRTSDLRGVIIAVVSSKSIQIVLAIRDYNGAISSIFAHGWQLLPALSVHIEPLDIVQGVIRRLISSEHINEPVFYFVVACVAGACRAKWLHFSYSHVVERPLLYFSRGQSCVLLASCSWHHEYARWQ